MNAPLRVGIMGAGRMAQGFDQPGDASVLTLAHAVQNSPLLTLGGFYDNRTDRAEAAERKWTCPPTPREREAWLGAGWDLIFIATPDACHAADLADAIARQPRGVLVEKPLAMDAQMAGRLLQQAGASAVALVTDFPRRWHTGVAEIAARLASGELGQTSRIVGTYSGGLRHNGVHLLDLIAAWVPGVERVERLGQTPGAAWLRLAAGGREIELFLAESPLRGGYAFALTLHTDRARIDLDGAPETLTLLTKAAHPNYPDFSTLRPATTWPMEDEPLLSRAVETLAGLARDPAAAARHLALEIERERFFGLVFDSLNQQPTAA